MELWEALRLWQLAQEAEGRRPSTLKTHRERLSLVFRHLAAQNVTQVEDLSPFPLRAYFAQYLKDHSPQGALSVYSSLRAFCNWLVAEGLLPESPLRRLRPPRVPRQSKPILQEGELRALLTLLGGRKSPLALRDAAIIALLLDTGMRVGEVVGLRLADLQGDGLLIRQTKTGRPRLAFLGRRASQALHRYLALGRPRLKPRCDALFLSRDGTSLTTDGVRLLLRRRGKELGLKLAPHRFRHTWATQMLRSGVDLETLRLLGGWADYSMLRTYAHLVEGDLREAMRRHSPLDRL